ncbi:MAG: peptidoglycan-binding domain-containing protein [Christensenellales bacterium]|nr:peptidoglycan-binding domain-containing protein [Christensenellales bacterium]
MRKSMSAWIRRGSIILLTMLLFLTAAVAENAQIPILIDGVRVAFFDADGNLLTPKAENGLLYVPLQAFCENMGLSAEVQGQSVAVDGTRIGMFDEAGNFLTPVQMDGVDYVPLAPFCNALGIQIAEENGGFSVTRKKAEQPAAETKEQTGKIALTPYNFGDYFSYSVRETNVKMTGMQVSGDGFFPGKYEVDYVLTCEARSVFEIENVSFQLVGKPRGLEMEDVVIYADMPASGSLNQTVHKSGDLLWTLAPEKEEASLKDVTLNDVSGCLIVNDQEKADTVNLASFQRGEMLLQAEEYDEAKKIFVSLIKIDYPNAQEKYDEAEVKKEETYQKAIALEEAGEYNQAILIYEKLGDYKDCMERIEKVKIELRYQEAVKEEEEENYSGAFQIYEELGEYKDSIARASFCVKKYQALNRVIEYTSKYDNICDEAIYTYDEQGFPQSLKKEDSQEIYTLDSDGFILAGRYEGKWSSDEGCTRVSDIVYNEQEDEAFCKTTYRSPNNLMHIDGEISVEIYEYVYDEHANILEKKVKIADKTYEYAYKYEYDAYGRIETETALRNQKVRYVEKYLYSDDGLLQQVKQFNSSGECTRTDTYTYAYYGTERVRTEEGLAEHRERMNQLIEEAQKEPEKTYTTLKPGSNSQEVLDARMKLYELGYFKKKPTQTEYTDSMADYVKKFEKDHGLTQDGVLSPEDQEVLFGL